MLPQSAGQTVRHHKVAEQDLTFPQELTQAEAAIENKDYATAEPLLKKVTANDPHNYQAWFDLGFVYNGLGNPDESIAAYRKSVAAKPDAFESNLNLGLMLAKISQPDAEQFLRAATTLKPATNQEEGRARAWLSLGHVLESNKTEQALDAYKQASSLLPKDPGPHLSAGALLQKDSRFADAEQEYKQVLVLDPNSSDALTGLANIYMHGNRFADAGEILGKLAALQPNDAHTHMQLGRVLAAAGKNDEAIAELQTAAKLAPADSDVQRDLADLYVASGKFDLAEGQYRTLLTSHPADPELHHGLGVVLLKQRKFPEAQQEFLATVKLKPDMGGAYGDLAAAAMENKDYALAIRATDVRAKFLPEVAPSFFSSRLRL